VCVFARKALGYFCLVFALISILTPGRVWGQAISTGTIQGAVTDPAGAVVAGATVTLTEAATNSSRSETTNDSGRYIFANVVPGIYDVSISKQGFRVTKFVKQEVTVGATIALDAKLELGSNIETVEVYAASVTLDASSATVGNDHHYQSCSVCRLGPRNSPVRGSGLQSEPDPGDLQWSGYLRTNAPGKL
jgi:Carboxypeptidase regulatory-like domain